MQLNKIQEITAANHLFFWTNIFFSSFAVRKISTHRRMDRVFEND